MLPAASKAAEFATLSIQKTCSALQSDPQLGISSEEAEKRRLNDGFNELELEEKESMIMKFVGQFENPLILLLLGR
jgi:P-type Ca2+ transporter type 2C